MHVVVGAGVLGSATARLLAEQGRQVRLVSRSGRGPRHPGIELRAADAADAAALRRATEGAEVIYNLVNPAYHRWLTDWPPIARSILAAAEAAGAVLVTMSNLYVYGPPNGPMTEEHQLASTLPKARVRIRMWEDALAAHQAGRVRVVEARASDYFGPGARDTSHLGALFVPRLLAGRTLWVLGSPDMPHTWTYVPDIARALAVLGSDERAWGRAWHVPSNPPLTRRQVAEEMARVAGVPYRPSAFRNETSDTAAGRPPMRGLPRWAVQAAGQLNPVLGEIPKIWYQLAEPFVMDSSAFTRAFGLTATPMEVALRATVEDWQARGRAAA